MPTDFDTRAETWDDESKVRRAEAVASGMRRAMPLRRSMTALEYGAGTGLLSFCLRDTLGAITLADSSAGMRAVAERKIAAANEKQMRVIDLDLMRDAVPGERYDVVFSMMTLHHVPDLRRGLAAFHELLNEGGYLCIADLDAEDGSFHGPEIDVHHGFERSALGKALATVGFVDVAIGDCFIVEHGSRTYPMFLATCRKR
jgi:ubiquinone/menaquinone biosynthesis C-methylase UbiE